jgi:hypothetical protein
VPALVLVAAIVAVLLDVVASIVVFCSDVLSERQRVAWLILVWLVPILGAGLALQLWTEARTFHSKPNRSEPGNEIIVGGDGDSSLGAADHGGGGDHGAM